MITDNLVNIVGTVIDNFCFSHAVLGEDFYLVHIATLRKSAYGDIIPVMISSRAIETQRDMSGMRVWVSGSFRSYNSFNPDGRRKLVLYVFADSFKETDMFDENIIKIFGTICKAPTYRKTPLGKEITDLLVAVNRNVISKSDYLPIIAWGRNAVYAADYTVGTSVYVEGRIQSRQYGKLIDGVMQEQTALEVSALRIERNNGVEHENGIQQESLLR
jgi:primosomal replication protein N